MLMWRTAGVLLACGAICAAPLDAFAGPATTHAPPEKAHKTEVPTRAIGIVINGEELAQNPAPRAVGYRIYVPIVRIFGALGIGIVKDRGGDLVAAAPGGRTIVLRIGSSSARIDNARVGMEGPAMEIDGATYVPLRFVADALGAQVTYDQKAARVEVISSLVGRTPSLTLSTGSGGSTQVVGTVSAIDLNSAPETLTVTRSGSVRTIAVNSDATFVIQDVVTKTNQDGTLRDIQPGDAVSVFIRKDGRVAQIVDRFASKAGTVAAVSPSAVVLQNGFVVTPERTTQITLNGAPAALGDLNVGDAVVVRSNPDTGEKRQLIASRPVAATPQAAASPGAARIAAFTVSAGRSALRAGDSFSVELSGTPGGKATFDIGTYVVGVPMTESRPGTYTARYTIPAGVNFGETPVQGNLTVNGVAAPRVQAASLIAVSTTPPAITDFAPPAGQTVNNAKPSIFATYGSPTDVGINGSAVRIDVNGLDVTASAVRTPTFITYSPSVALPDGTVTVAVTVEDAAGNKTVRNWSFTIRTR